MVDFNHGARSLRPPETDAEKAAWMREHALAHSGNLTDEGWAQLYDLEHAPMTTESQELARLGFEWAPADDLTDAQLHRELWRLLERLARERRVFVAQTNHLSDRELYIELTERRLVAEKRSLPVRQCAAWQVNLLDDCEECDLDLFLRFYASDEEREYWEEAGESLPPAETAPFDRDRLLPKPGFPAHQPIMLSIPNGRDGRLAGVYLNASQRRMVDGAELD